jgi:hypothetical protein
MTEDCNSTFLLKEMDPDSKTSRETAAVEYYTRLRYVSRPNGKKLTQKEVGLKFKISEKRMSIIIRNPDLIGNTQGSPCRLPAQEELRLVKWIRVRVSCGIPTTNQELIDKANQFIKIRFKYGKDQIKIEVGRNWLEEFFTRQQKLISKRKVQGMDTSRDRSKCTARVIEYFSYLRDLLVEYNFRDDKIFNCDETPCPIVTIISESIWIKGVKDAHVKQADNRVQLTMMPVVAANGTALKPLIIYKGKTVDKSFLSGNLETLITTNDTSYMNKDVFREWATSFVEMANPTAALPVLLIMDNCPSHLDFESFELFNKNNVHVVGLPPHTSDFPNLWICPFLGHLKINTIL